MLTKFTDREAVATVMQVRDEIRNGKDLSDLSFGERTRRTDALATVINIALDAIENKEKTHNE